jgi:hypothetical protein
MHLDQDEGCELVATLPKGRRESDATLLINLIDVTP